MNENDVIETKEELKADKPVMIPINFTMISGNNETSPADNVACARFALVTSNQFHGRIMMRFDDLLAEIKRCEEENNHD